MVLWCEGKYTRVTRPNCGRLEGRCQARSPIYLCRDGDQEYGLSRRWDQTVGKTQRGEVSWMHGLWTPSIHPENFLAGSSLPLVGDECHTNIASARPCELVSSDSNSQSNSQSNSNSKATHRATLFLLSGYNHLFLRFSRSSTQDMYIVCKFTDTDIRRFCKTR